jgi:hypothetical protein
MGLVGLMAKFRTIMFELREKNEDMDESDIRNMTRELCETWESIEYLLNAGERFPSLVSYATRPYNM